MQMNICLRDLPTRIKSTLPSRVPTHAYADWKISGQQRTQLYKEFPRIHEVGHSKKNDAQVKPTIDKKWATGKMQYNKTRSIEGRYRFWEFAVSVYMVWCTMQWSGFAGIGFGSSLYRFPCFQGINTNKDLLWKDFCMNLFACCSNE